jgi:hypothetical protein
VRVVRGITHGLPITNVIEPRKGLGATDAKPNTVGVTRSTSVVIVAAAGALSLPLKSTAVNL